MSAFARVAHGLPGRTRLRIPGQRGREEYFARVAGRLSECSGVSSVEANFRTGSVLIRHEAPFTAIASFAADHGLFTLGAETNTRATVSQRASEELAGVDAGILRFSAGSLDFRSLVFITLVGMSLVQIYRGQIMAPAATLLWYALTLLGSGEARPGAGDARASEASAGRTETA